jgi:hypothetical protein
MTNHSGYRCFSVHFSVFLKGLGFYEIMVFHYTHACGSLKKKKKRAPSGGAAGGLNKLYSLVTLIPSSWRELQKMQVNMHCMVYSLFGNGNCVYFVLSILEREREREREKQAPTSCVLFAF